MARYWTLIASATLALALASCGGGSGGMGGMGGMGSGSNTGSGAMNGTVPPGVTTGTVTNPAVGAQTVNVSLSDYTVKLDRTTLPPGPVHLVVKNDGQRPHSFQLYPTTSGQTGNNNQMNMAQGGAMPGAVGYLALIPVGATMGLDVTLPAGLWELACHLQDSENGKAFDHYDRGMKTLLTVQAA